MGYNLKRLMNQYGVGTASKAGYAGNADPGAAPEQPIFTAQGFPEGSPEAIERAKILSDYQQLMYEYQPKKDAYDTDQSAYDAYSGGYDQRLQDTPMYAAKQFQTQEQVQAPYYGNVLKNPIYSPSLAIEAVDADGEVIDIGTGGDGTAIDIGTGGGTQSNPFAPDDNQFDPFAGFDPTQASNTGTSAQDQINDIMLADDFNGVWTDELNDLVAERDNTSSNNFVSGGGSDGFGNLGVVGDVFGGIGDALNITNYDGSQEDKPSGDDGGFSWSDSSWNPSNWEEGGSVKGVTPSGRLIKGYASDGSVVDETIENITEVASLDDLVAEQIEAKTEGGNNIAELREMLAASSMPSGQNAGSIRGELGTARQKFMDLVTAQADSAGTGPSESEKWFRLAAAFGKPTQSGHFMENLGLANEAMAGVASERRAAKTDAAGLQLRGAEINIDFLKEDLAAATAAGTLERDYKRGLAETLMEFEMSQVEIAEQREFDLAVISGEREYESGKAKTTAAKMADDLGLTGTARNEWIVKYYDDQKELAKLEFEAAANAVNELSTGELNLKVKTEDAIAAADNTIGIINEAMSINDMAYAGSIWDSATKVFKGAFNVDDPRYKATERMENLLSSLSLAQLKTTFGGAGITDSERRALDALQGLGSKTPAARLAILERALAVTKRVGLRSAKRLSSITSGTYGRKDTGEE